MSKPSENQNQFDEPRQPIPDNGKQKVVGELQYMTIEGIKPADWFWSGINSHKTKDN